MKDRWKALVLVVATGAACKPSSSDPGPALPPDASLGDLTADEASVLCEWSNRRAQAIPLDEHDWCQFTWSDFSPEDCRQVCDSYSGKVTYTDLLDCEIVAELGGVECEAVTLAAYRACVEGTIEVGTRVVKHYSCDWSKPIEEAKRSLPASCIEILSTCPGVIPPEIVSVWLAAGGDFSSLHHAPLQAVYADRDSAHTRLCEALDRCYPESAEHGSPCTVESDTSFHRSFEERAEEELFREGHEWCLASAYLLEPIALVRYGSCAADAYREFALCIEDQDCPSSGLDCINAYEARREGCDQLDEQRLVERLEELESCDGYALARF